MSRRIGFTSIFLLIGLACAFSQVNIPDYEDRVMADRLSYILDLHDSIIGQDKNLVNGEFYYPHQKNARNHPFYLKESWVRGSVNISGETYNNLLLRYDIHTDQLLLLHIADGAELIELNKNNIHSFTLENAYFIHLDSRGEGKGKDISAGFYQEVYMGELHLYARWVKKRTINSGFLPDEFKQEVDLLLIRGDTCHHIKNNKALKNILADRKKEVGKYMKNNNIHVRHTSPEKVGMVLSYYETLNSVEK